MREGGREGGRKGGKERRKGGREKERDGWKLLCLKGRIKCGGKTMFFTNFE